MLDSLIILSLSPGWEDAMQKILLLTGMTPDPRIFERLLPLLPSAVVVDWIPPKSNESIASYAERLSRTIINDQPTIVCGVSFGGIVACELASCLNAFFYGVQNEQSYLIHRRRCHAGAYWL